jgi:hypothetical protein
MLLQLQDFGTSLWQLHRHAISSPRRLKGACCNWPISAAKPDDGGGCFQG